MKDVLIYGAGGFGREIASLIKRINNKKPTWNLLGFIDDDSLSKPIGSVNEYGKILGDLDFLNNYQHKVSVIIALGKPTIVKKVYDKIKNPNVDFPNLIADDSHILDSTNFEIGKGNILCSFVSMSCHVKIGDFNVFNNRCSVGHDAQIGCFNSFMTATRISGSTIIGNLNFFGVSSIVLPQIKIGNNVVVGAGSVVIRKTKDDCVYVGNPAKKITF